MRISLTASVYAVIAEGHTGPRLRAIPVSRDGQITLTLYSAFAPLLYSSSLAGDGGNKSCREKVGSREAGWQSARSE